MTLFHYRCTILRVVDGDTLDVEIDLGLRVFTKARIRLLGVNTPEIYSVKKDSPEWNAGKKAEQYVVDWLKQRKNYFFTLKTHKDKTGKYGRWIGELFAHSTGHTTQCLNNALVDQGWGDQ